MKYSVSVPVAGYFQVTIEADDEADAKNKAQEVEWTTELKTKADMDIIELEMYETICEGNVLHVPLNEIDIEKIK